MELFKFGGLFAGEICGGVCSGLDVGVRIRLGAFDDVLHEAEVAFGLGCVLEEAEAEDGFGAEGGVLIVLGDIHEIAAVWIEVHDDGEFGVPLLVDVGKRGRPDEDVLIEGGG